MYKEYLKVLIFYVKVYTLQEFYFSEIKVLLIKVVCN